jgi:hypothetical protein
MPLSGRSASRLGALNARGVNITIDPKGFEYAAANLDQTGGRMADLRPGFEKVMDVLESAEAQHFTKLGGKFVRTGDVRASLTLENADGAIRRAHMQEMEFGSSIWYSVFLRADRKKPRKRKGKQYGLSKRGRPLPPGPENVTKKGRASAVLVFPTAARREANEILMDHIMGRLV